MRGMAMHSGEPLLETRPPGKPFREEAGAGQPACVPFPPRLFHRERRPDTVRDHGDANGKAS